jgi:hypothetical protein
MIYVKKAKEEEKARKDKKEEEKATMDLFSRRLLVMEKVKRVPLL